MSGLDWAQVALATVLGAAGFFLVRSSRTRDGALAPGRPLPFGTWAPSVPTRYVLGLSLFLGAYHLVAYALPANWLPLRVPGDRFWMLATALTAACGLSVAMDLVDGRDGEDPPGA